MNLDQVEGKWKQLKGSAKIKWGELTDDDLDKVEGSAERLAGVLQERYGKTKEEADAEVDTFFKDA
ncbi:CsbD family protein [Albirhodobacter sp. R86504]|uniref:CsbD family protein n=1 Tax=Albirhodobacter sp. R86504 TaxID=3093848 RepID=UPI00366CEAC8